MPTVQLDAGGQPDLLPVKYEDGPLFGNTTWNIDWRRLALRQLFTVNVAQDTHTYKVVGIEDAEVLCDFRGTT